MNHNKLLIFLLLLLVAGFDSKAWNRRDQWQQPEKVMDVIGIKPGMVVGEAGAGRGYFTFKLSKRVGKNGKIYANDISRSSLDYITERCRQDDITNIQTIVGKVEDPLFPAGKLDMVFMCYVFHHLEKPVPFLQNTKRSLKPGATVVILEQEPEKTGSHHFMTREEIEEELLAADYQILRVETFLEKDTIYICRPREHAIE